MGCNYTDECGGCRYRQLGQEEYRTKKCRDVQAVLDGLKDKDYRFAEPVFVGDNQRRRATLAFSCRKGKLVLGFNRSRSAEIVDLASCYLLTPKINAALPELRRLLAELCAVKIPQMKKNKQVGVTCLQGGDLQITEADNGLDIVLQFDGELNLDYRMIIFEFAQNSNDVARISHRRSENGQPETIVEKSKPYINIAGYEVFIPAGTFLQASKASEQALIEIVLRYAGESGGKIADLFCGVGTFSYPLSKNIKNKIVAADSSRSLLEGFRQSVNKNMIPNIEIVEKNLFKYPLDEKELNGFDLVVFDPPRAGAEAQAKKIAAMGTSAPQKVIAVSCNPHSFVKDANILIGAGFKLEEITLVDQFAYSNHSELVALFTKKD